MNEFMIGNKIDKLWKVKYTTDGLLYNRFFYSDSNEVNKTVINSVLEEIESDYPNVEIIGVECLGERNEKGTLVSLTD